jgi:hypothetical protein
MSQENVERLRWLYGEWATGNLWVLREIDNPQWSSGHRSRCQPSDTT